MSAERSARRRAREQSDFRNNAGAVEISAAPAVPLEVMLDVPIDITIQGTSYEIREFPMRQLAKMGAVLSRVPSILLARALLEDQESQDPAKLADKFNEINLLDGDSAYAADEILGVAIETYNKMTEDEVENMLDLCVKTINTGHVKIDDVTVENFKDSLQPTDVVRIIRGYMTKNSGFRQRF